MTNVLSRNHDTAVILHLYYPDLWPELFRYLQHIKNGYDLYVSIPDSSLDTVEEMVLADVPSAHISRLPNRGRDIAAFLSMLELIASYEYQQICKIHTKKSLHRFDGHEWRVQILEALLGSEVVVNKIISVFDCYPQIGVVGPSSELLDYGGCVGANRQWVNWVRVRLGLKGRKANFSFFAGSMFWFKPQTMFPILELKLSLDNFEPEQGQVDGTLAHAIERIFLLAAAKAGYCSVTTESVTKGYLANLDCSKPFKFPRGRKCQRFWLLRNIYVRILIAWVRSWIAWIRSR